MLAGLAALPRLPRAKACGFGLLRRACAQEQEEVNGIPMERRDLFSSSGYDLNMLQDGVVGPCSLGNAS